MENESQDPASAASPSPVGAERRWWQLERDDWLVIGWALSIKALLCVFGASVQHTINNHRLGSWYELLETWNRWDAPGSIAVARDGYTSGRSLVIHPLFPALVRVFAWITHDYLVSALLVSTLGLLVAVVLFRRLVRIDYEPSVAREAVWFLLIFPTAYIIQVGYTESVFLAMLFGAFLAARTNRWATAGICGALAAAARPTGILLLPVLGIEAAYQWYRSRRWRWSWLWILLILLGYSVYLWINYSVSGNALSFFDVRRTVFYVAEAWPWQGIAHMIGDLQRIPEQSEIMAAQELFFIALGLTTSIVSWFVFRPSYAAWMTLNWLSFCSLSFVVSTPRYTLVMFPLQMLFALWSRNRFWFGLITLWSLFYFALFASLFCRGWWAF